MAEFQVGQRVDIVRTSDESGKSIFAPSAEVFYLAESKDYLYYTERPEGAAFRMSAEVYAFAEYVEPFSFKLGDVVMRKLYPMAPDRKYVIVKVTDDSVVYVHDEGQGPRTPLGIEPRQRSQREFTELFRLADDA